MSGESGVYLARTRSSAGIYPMPMTSILQLLEPLLFPPHWGSLGHREETSLTGPSSCHTQGSRQPNPPRSMALHGSETESASQMVDGNPGPAQRPQHNVVPGDRVLLCTGTVTQHR